MDHINRLPNIQNKIKFQLNAKKVDNLESLYRLIDEFDTDKKGSLDKAQFQKFLSKLGVFLTTQELRVIYDFYDKNKDGNIDYIEFVNLIRTNMTEKRMAIVKHAFNFLDVQGIKQIPLELLKSQYKAELHPRVKTRQKTVQQVKDEFLESISKKSSNGTNITEVEFFEYYSDINATLPNEKEEYFVELLLSTWGITSSQNYIQPDRVQDLEIIVFEKIRQKTLEKEDEGKTIYKIFKYLDLKSAGVVNYEQFINALQQLGCTFSDKEIQALFSKYDKENKGKFAYDEFASRIAMMGSGIQPNVNPVFELHRQPPTKLLAVIRGQLLKKGLYGVRQLTTLFKNLDKNNNGFVDRNEFTWGLAENGLKFPKNDIDQLFRYFDKYCNDQVNYKDFVKVLRGELNEVRQAVITEAFRKLNVSGSGVITLDDLLKTFNVKSHLSYLSKAKNEKEVLEEFIRQWDVFDKKTNEITLEDFMEYYKDISVTIDDDFMFVTIVKKAWQLD